MPAFDLSQRLEPLKKPHAEWAGTDDALPPVLHSRSEDDIVITPRSIRTGVSNAGVKMRATEQPREPGEVVPDSLETISYPSFDSSVTFLHEDCHVAPKGFIGNSRDGEKHSIAEEGVMQVTQRTFSRHGVFSNTSLRRSTAPPPPPPIIGAVTAPNVSPNFLKMASNCSALERFAQRTVSIVNENFDQANSATLSDSSRIVSGYLSQTKSVKDDTPKNQSSMGSFPSSRSLTSRTMTNRVSRLSRSSRSTRDTRSSNESSSRSVLHRLASRQSLEPDSPGKLGNRRGSFSSMLSEARMGRRSSKGSDDEKNKNVWTGVLTSRDFSVGKQSSKMRIRSCCKIMRVYTERLVKSFGFSAILAFVSLFALYGDDIRLAFFQKEDDHIFNWITCISLVLFTVELILSSLVLKDYFLSFFFLLDLVSTVSLILDLTFVWDALVGNETFSLEAGSATTDDNALAQSEYARAGRSSRVGTRLVRILRVVRLVRMTRIFKFFLFRSNQQKTNMREQRLLPGGLATVNEKAKGQQESLVGQKLSERTTLWVIVLVLAMLVMVPMLDVGDFDLMLSSSAQYGVDVINQAWSDFIRNDKRGSSRSVLQESRLAWEEELLTYVFYHNNVYARCPSNIASGADCASDFLFQLCFFGFVARHDATNGTSSLTARDVRVSSLAWETISNTIVGVPDMRYVVGQLPIDIKDRILKPWPSDCGESNYDMYGVSLWRDEPCPWRSRRVQEVTWFWPMRSVDTIILDGRMVFFFDVAPAISWQATMSMFQTSYIILVLTVGALLFSKDADKLVLHPIETMISKIDIIRRDPLYAITMGDDVYRRKMKGARRKRSSYTKAMKWKVTSSVKSGMNLVRRSSLYFTKDFSSGEETQSTSVAENQPKQRRRWQPQLKKRKKEQPNKVELMETKILENTIIKLGSLLALGFGEAGTVVIGKNLDANQATVDVLIPGRQVKAIYGSCRINNFTATTEVLGEKTVVFVNRIAKIVHSTIDEHLGSANKNMGEAFLLVWRLDHHQPALQTKLSDLSVLSFVQIIVAINRDMELAGYRDHPALLARLHNYRVTLTFGLHIGNSIEGPIGSKFKIDASYVSSHVTLAQRLESVAICYNVMILMTEPLVRSCSDGVQRYFRAIDRLLMIAAKAPIRIFSFDVDSEALFTNYSKVGQRKEQNRYAARLHRQGEKYEKIQDSYQPLNVFATDRHIKRMRAIYFLEFFQKFEMGYLNYEAGEWGVAANVLEEASHALRDRAAWHHDATDGPAGALIDYMRSFGFVAPASWAGFRKFKDLSTLQLAGRISKI